MTTPPTQIEKSNQNPYISGRLHELLAKTAFWIGGAFIAYGFLGGVATAEDAAHLQGEIQSAAFEDADANETDAIAQNVGDLGDDGLMAVSIATSGMLFIGFGSQMRKIGKKLSEVADNAIYVPVTQQDMPEIPDNIDLGRE